MSRCRLGRPEVFQVLDGERKVGNFGTMMYSGNYGSGQRVGRSFGPKIQDQLPTLQCVRLGLGQLRDGVISDEIDDSQLTTFIVRGKGHLEVSDFYFLGIELPLDMRGQSRK